MTREEAIARIKDHKIAHKMNEPRAIYISEALDMAIKALEQEQKTGHWIKKEYWKPLPYDTEPLDYDNYDEKIHSEKVYHYYCSECDRNEGEIKPIHKYCPNCGAKMVEPQESEDKE